MNQKIYASERNVYGGIYISDEKKDNGKLGKRIKGEGKPSLSSGKRYAAGCLRIYDTSECLQRHAEASGRRKF